MNDFVNYFIAKMNNPTEMLIDNLFSKRYKLDFNMYKDTFLFAIINVKMVYYI